MTPREDYSMKNQDPIGMINTLITSLRLRTLRSSIVLVASACAVSTNPAQSDTVEEEEIAAEIPQESEEIGVFDPDPPLLMPSTDGTDTVTICGQNNLQHVEYYGDDPSLIIDGVSKDFVAKHEPFTVQFQWLRGQGIRAALNNGEPGPIFSTRWPTHRSCTGTLIPGNRILTAAHCFMPLTGSRDIQLAPNSPVPSYSSRYYDTPYWPQEDGSRKYAAHEDIARSMQVVFNYQRRKSGSNTSTERIHPVIQLIEHSNDDLDYAIVQLGPDASGMEAESHTAPAILEIRQPTDGETIAIIQHPRGERKQIDAGQISAIRRVRVNGVERAVHLSEVFYGNVDTRKGSSGSGILSTNGAVIGVHTNPGCIPETRGGGGYNRGVKLISIANASKTLLSTVGDP